MVSNFRVAILSNGFVWKIHYFVPLNSGGVATYDTGNLNIFENFDKFYVIMGIFAFLRTMLTSIKRY